MPEKYGTLPKTVDRYGTPYRRGKPVKDLLVGLNALIQATFIERVNLIFRQGVSALSRRTWAYAHSEQHLLLHWRWFRAYYHFARLHESLRLPVPGLKRRYRPRTPAMALGLTGHIWEVCDLLRYPVPWAA